MPITVDENPVWVPVTTPAAQEDADVTTFLTSNQQHADRTAWLKEELQDEASLRANGEVQLEAKITTQKLRIDAHTTHLTAVDAALATLGATPGPAPHGILLTALDFHAPRYARAIDLDPAPPNPPSNSGNEWELMHVDFAGDFEANGNYMPFWTAGTYDDDNPQYLTAHVRLPKNATVQSVNMYTKGTVMWYPSRVTYNNSINPPFTRTPFAFIFGNYANSTLAAPPVHTTWDLSGQGVWLENQILEITMFRSVALEGVQQNFGRFVYGEIFYTDPRGI